MPKLTGGEGWSLSSDDDPKPAKKTNPDSPKPKIRLENRAGKQVTTISGLHTYGTPRLEQIARDLKTACGTGGTVKNGVIEIQGDRVEFIQRYFLKLKDRS